MSTSQGQTKHLPPVTVISPTDDASITRVIEITARAFQPAPLLHAMVTEQDNLSPPFPQEIPWSRRLGHYVPGMTAIAKAGSDVMQAGDWSAVAIWQTPEYNGPAFGESRKVQSDLTRELRRKFGDAERRLLSVTPDAGAGGDGDGSADGEEVKLRPAYHLDFLARNSDPDVPKVEGAISALIRPYLERADQEKVPVWLESLPGAVSVYKHYGFRVVEPVTIGEGRFGADGWPKEGGEGVTVYVMAYGI